MRKITISYNKNVIFDKLEERQYLCLNRIELKRFQKSLVHGRKGFQTFYKSFETLRIYFAFIEQKYKGHGRKVIQEKFYPMCVVFSLVF